MRSPGSLPVEPARFVEIHESAGPARRLAEAFLEGKYLRAFGGRIRSHYPMMMSVRGADGAVLAAAGFRPAASGPLFLEQYLDEPVEAAIARELDLPVRRDGVIEIGNLASTSPCVSRVLFSALAAHLRDLGGAYAVATATRQLRRSFERIRFPVSALAKAEAARLAEGAADWGAYYGRDPQVVVGSIGGAMPALRGGVLAAEALAARLARRAQSEVVR